MGLLSDIFGSSSHSQTTQNTSTVLNTQLAGGAIQAPTVYGTGNRQNVNVTTTDAGTVLMATDISQHALALGAQEADTGAAVAIAGLAHAADAYTSSLALVGGVTHDSLTATANIANSSVMTSAALAGQVVDTNTQFAGKALDSVARFSTDALNAGSFISSKALDDVSAAYADAQSRTAGVVNTVLPAIENLAAQTTQSNQQSTDATLTKVAWAAAVAVVAIFAFRAQRA